MNDTLEIKGLNVDLKTFKLKNISMSIPAGSVMGVIGRSGAGKTTLMKAMLDERYNQEGKITFFGRYLMQERVCITQDLAYIPDTCPFSLGTKVKKLAKLYNRLYEGFDIEKFERLCKHAGISGKCRLTKLSTGQVKLVQLYLALARRTKFLIMDEPMANLDPVTRNEMVEHLRNYMQEEDHSIMISSHILSDLEKLVDYIALIQNGSIILSDAIDHVQEMFYEVQGTTEEWVRNDQSKLLYVQKTNDGYAGMCRKEDVGTLVGLRYQRADLETMMCYMVGGNTND